jgi:hypothetical protein
VAPPIPSIPSIPSWPHLVTWTVRVLLANHQRRNRIDCLRSQTAVAANAFIPGVSNTGSYPSSRPARRLPRPYEVREGQVLLLRASRSSAWDKRTDINLLRPLAATSVRREQPAAIDIICPPGTYDCRGDPPKSNAERSATALAVPAVGGTGTRGCLGDKLLSRRTGAPVYARGLR